MPLSDAQKKDILLVLEMLYSHTVGRRNLSIMFKSLPDREAWKEYYDVIPQPRSLDGVKASIEKNKVASVEIARGDIELIFKNAMHFNQEGSVIWADAKTLLEVFEKTWASKFGSQKAGSSSGHKLIIKRTKPSMSPVVELRSSKQPASAQSVAVVKPEPIAEPSTSPRVSRSKAKSTTPALAPLTPTPPLPPVEPSENEDYYEDGDGDGAEDVPNNDVDFDAPADEQSAGAGPSSSRGAAEHFKSNGATADGDETRENANDGPSPREDAVDLPAERIVQYTESRMRIWEGPGLEGWMGPPRGDPHSRYLEILGFLKTFRVATTGDRPAVALENIPEMTDVPFLYHHDPIGFAFIEDKALAKFYGNPQSFDMDLYRLFEKGRHIYRDTSKEDFGRVVLLQRMYQHLTSSALNAVPAMTRASFNFSSVSAGPGNDDPAKLKLLEAAPSARSNNKDRDSLDTVTYKGSDYQLGDYVHLVNPDDASKPIVGQIYRVFVQPSKPGQFFLTICWYFLPEQTIHARTRVFHDKEALKSSIYVDHTIEDVIEKIGVQFYAKHVRGRPLPPAWYPGWPLYVCDQRYNDKEHTFVRIKNWISCIPEEVRAPNWMPIQAFGGRGGEDEEGGRVAHPRKVKSPFLKGINGPGRLGEEGVESSSSTIASGSAPTLPEPSATGRRPYTKRGTGAIAQRKAKEAADAAAAASAAAAAARDAYMPPPAPVQTKPLAPAASRPQVIQRKRKMEDRTAIAAAGGQAYMNGAKIDVLPTATVEKFDRDPKTGKLLWYSGPPIHVTPPLAFAPRHSLTYLTYLAKQQALLEQTGAEDDELEHASKRPRAADGSRPSEPSLRQLLDRWRINPDGGTDYIGDEEPNLEFDAAMASAEQSRDLLARSIRQLADRLTKA